MSGQWKKLGLVFAPNARADWMMSHAALPVAVALDATRHRVFFSTRDGANRSNIGWVDIDIEHPTRVLDIARAPALAPGAAGSFDDSGIGLGSIVASGGELRLYYMGWNLGVTAPWRNSIGLAVGDAAAARFERWSAGPIMDRSPLDPYTLSYPWVAADGRDNWRMWYGTALEWGAHASDMRHAIRSADSADGLEWRRSPRLAVELRRGETAVARPAVQRHGPGYRMWYCHRGDAYRIGYATSEDGTLWQRRDDEAGIAPSAEGWDADMVCYPSVFEARGVSYMLYNGNRYGLTGFGIAVFEG